MNTRTRGDGRIFTRTGSAFLWCAYYLRGKEYRESTGTADPDKAAKYLKRRLKEVGADQIGKAVFVGPQQERMKVSKLLEALEEDCKLRGKASSWGVHQRSNSSASRRFVPPTWHWEA